MDFTSPDDIEIVKAKKMASASKKLNMVSSMKSTLLYNLTFYPFVDSIHAH